MVRDAAAIGMLQSFEPVRECHLNPANPEDTGPVGIGVGEKVTLTQASGRAMTRFGETTGPGTAQLEGTKRRTQAWFDPSLKTIFDDSRDGVLVVNILGHRVYSNPALDDLVGADACLPSATSEAPPYVSPDQRPKYVRLLGGMASLLSVDGSGTVSTWLDLVTPDRGRVRTRLTISAYTSVNRARFALCLFAPEPSVANSGASVTVLEPANGAGSPSAYGRQRPSDASGRDPMPELARLTRREREVLAMLLDGRRVASISRSLYLSEHTVRNHLKAIFRKLGTHSQTELLDRFRPPVWNERSALLELDNSVRAAP